MFIGEFRLFTTSNLTKGVLVTLPGSKLVNMLTASSFSYYLRYGAAESNSFTRYPVVHSTSSEACSHLPGPDITRFSGVVAVH